jgi:hypothetical protein
VKVKTELLRTGKNTAGFEIPDSVVEALGGGKRPKVAVTVNGFSYRSSIASMGGRFLLGMSSERRAAAGVTPGEVLELQIELDTAPREVEVPPDFAAALASDAAAQATWDGLSYSNRQWHVLQIEGAKQAETRARRIAKSVGTLGQGKAR